jgi:transposase
MSVGQTSRERIVASKSIFCSPTPPCLVGMEACGTSHFWAREVAKFGH